MDTQTELQKSSYKLHDSFNPQFEHVRLLLEFATYCEKVI